LFVGWKLPASVLAGEIGLRTDGAVRLLRFLLRYLIPLSIGIVAVVPLIGLTP